MKYYAVKAENQRVIVDSWEKCQEVLKDSLKPKYKSFKTKEEAEAFLEDRIATDDVIGTKAYIDGSYDSKTGCYSFGGVLIHEGKEYPYYKKYEKDAYSDLRNVAGEIKGAGYIINFCARKGIKELHIFYDYVGIEKWYTKEWRANSSIAKEYQKFADSVRDQITVIFHKVKSHTNDYYNDMADQLAKEALGI